MPSRATKSEAAPKSTDSLHARLVLFGAAKMSPKVAKDVAAWLRDRAAELEDGSRLQFASRFTARYYTSPKAKRR